MDWPHSTDGRTLRGMSCVGRHRYPASDFDPSASVGDQRERPFLGVGGAGQTNWPPRLGAASLIGGYAAAFTSSGFASW